MLQFDLDAEIETIGHYRKRVRQCEALGEFALAEHIRDILVVVLDLQRRGSEVAVDLVMLLMGTEVVQPQKERLAPLLTEPAYRSIAS